MLSKRIFNLPFKCRKLFSAPNVNIVGGLCQVNASTDHVKLMSSKVDRNPRRSKMFEPKSSSLVLDLLEFNFNDSNLTSADTIKTLSQLVQLCRQQASSPDKLVHEDFFKNLCNLIISQSNNLSITDAHYIAKLLLKLRLHSSSKTFSHLLERLDTLISTASLADYNKIMDLVKRMPSDPLTQAMKARLIQKFLFKMSVDEKDFEFLVEAFRFACFNMQDKELLKVITEALKNSDFDTQTTYNILSIIKTLNVANHYSADFQEILTKAQNALILNIDQCENKDIAIMLIMSANKEKRSRIDQFYNKTLIDKAITKLISSECSLSDGIKCLHATLIFKHTNKQLLDYLSGKIYVEKEVDEKSIDYSVIFYMLEGFANLKHKPICWETFVKLIKNIDFSKYEIETLLYRVYHLACLDHYEPELLDALFKNNKKLQFKGSLTTNHVFLQLYQKLKTLPDYSGPLPTQSQLQSLNTMMRTVTDYPLYPYLKEALGGTNYVKTNVRTKLYHQIEHVIAIQPDGEPFAINSIKKQETTENNDRSRIEYLEDMNIPENCHVIAVVQVPSFWYTRNTDEILGPFATSIETLETLSCQVVTVSERVWQSLPKESRTAFLMDAIKSKLNDKQRNAEVAH